MVGEEDSGWLRAATFGYLDGLVSSTALVIALIGTDLVTESIVIAGLLALISGAMSMSGGEFLSIQTYKEQPGAVQFSPWVAAGCSFLSFGTGSLIPLVPVLLGNTNLVLLCVVSGLALFISGALATKFTYRSWWFGGLRQLIIGGLATLVTYVFGSTLS